MLLEKKKEEVVLEEIKTDEFQNLANAPEQTADEFINSFGDIYETKQAAPVPPEFAAKRTEDLEKYARDMALMKKKIAEKEGRQKTSLDKKY